MKTTSRLLAVIWVLAAFTADVARAFSISAVTLSPGNVVEPTTELRMTIDIVTPSAGTWLYAPTRVSSNANNLRVDVYPTSGPLTVISSLRETVTLGVFPAGAYNYEVVIHPNFPVNWGTRTNRGGFTVQASPTSPMVSLELVEQDAMETRIDQNAIFWAEFRVLRTGSVASELVVYLNTRQGTARLGEDYRLERVNDGSTVRFLPGERSVNVRLYPIDDDFYEGDETVFFHLIAPPSGSDAYEIEFARSSVSMVIRDNDPVTTRLDITAPRNGQHFEAGGVIELRAQIIGPGSSNSWSVEFFDGNQRIGTTQPGGAIWWQNAIGGPHIINARATDSAGITLEARPVTISVGPGPAWPVVRVGAGRGQTLEPCPVCFSVPGVITVSRTGPTNEALTVYLQYDGPAVPALDYQSLPHQVTIPAGTNSAHILVLVIDDLLVEGPEIVRASIALPELATLGYIASVHASEAMVVINDDESGAPEARLDIAEPQEGAQLAAGMPIAVSALGVWTRGEVDRPVEFFAGNLLIGRSNPPQLGRPTIPGLPSVHTILWTNPPPGQHALTAKFTLGPGLAVTSPPVNVTVGAEPPRTVVSIGTDDAVARELSPNWPAIDSARFRISRSGDLTRDLQVFFWVRGSATSGQDYLDLYSQSPVRIPAGERSVTLDVVPRHDELMEGMETVFIELLPSPWFGPLPDYGYDVDPLNRGAVAVILDAEAGPALDIAFPDDGQNFIEPRGIDIVVAAYHLTRDILGVDFYADGVKIGESRLIFDKTVSGGLIEHRFHWSNPSLGPHVLTAQGFNENGELVAVSSPIHITVSPAVSPAIVRIEATQPIAEEDSIPFDRLNLVGIFTISRSGPTNDPLPVYVQYSGSATAAEDYPALPWVVSIPAGAASTQIRVEPIADGVSEGIETLIASVSACPPSCPGCPLPPCFNFSVDPAHANATVFIRDDGLARASLLITNPKDGANFNIGETILIAATAIDLDGYISRVEFFDGDRRIGESEIVFIRAPDPGTPIHHSFEWRGAAAGSHVLTVRAAGANGVVLMSPPVRITVGPGSTQPPQVAITRPVNGATFPPDASIEIVAETRDPNGYVRRMEFFADRRKIGESSVEFVRPPDPDQPQTFTFLWRHPDPGSHSLTAQATDDGGNSATSAPVSIAVAGSEPFPMVTVIARDAWAVEPGTNSSPNTATFRIRRFGPTNDSLLVTYSLRGTAENGIDYDQAPAFATIPAGRRTVLVTITPLADNLREGKETVVLRLHEPPPSSPELGVINAYRIGWPGVAVALISDPPSPLAEPRCFVLPGHLLHVCFTAGNGHNFRLEASTDLWNWETLCDTWSSDGLWHFIDTEMDNQARRFYRLTPEPVAEADE